MSGICSGVSLLSKVCSVSLTDYSLCENIVHRCIHGKKCDFIVFKALKKGQCSWFGIKDTVLSCRGIFGSIPGSSKTKSLFFHNIYSGIELRRVSYTLGTTGCLSHGVERP